MRDRLTGLPRLESIAGTTEVAIATSHRSRRRGLAGRKVVADSSLALLLPRTRSVHTVGMAFDLDLIWLDSTGTVVRVDLSAPPVRIRTCLRAVHVIETPAGCSAAVLAVLPGAVFP